MRKRKQKNRIGAWLLSSAMMLTMCAGPVSASDSPSALPDGGQTAAAAETTVLQQAEEQEVPAEAVEPETEPETESQTEPEPQSTAAAEPVTSPGSNVPEAEEQTHGVSPEVQEASVQVMEISVTAAAPEETVQAETDEETPSADPDDESADGSAAAETGATESDAEENVTDPTAAEEETSEAETPERATEEEITSAEAESVTAAEEKTSEAETTEAETSVSASGEEITSAEAASETAAEEETLEDVSEEETSEEDTSTAPALRTRMLQARRASASIGAAQISGNRIVVSGSVSAAGTYYIYAIEPYETAANFSMDTAVQCASFTASAGSFTQSFDYSEDLLVRKFIVCSDDKGSCISGVRYITNPEAEASTSFLQKLPNKKGLLVYTDERGTKEAASLGVTSSVVNWLLDDFVNEDGSLNEHGIAVYCAQLKRLNDNGIVPYVILLLPADAPDFMKASGIQGKSAPYFVAWNTDTAEGVRLYQKLLTALAQAADGLASRWIIGNEVNNNLWDNMGPTTMAEHVAGYSTTFRIAYNTIKSVNSAAQIYIPTDHVWYGNGGDYAEGSTSAYNVRPFLTQWNTKMQQEGDISWALAFHAYSEPLTDSRAWTDGSPIYTPGGAPISLAAVTSSQNTNIITMKNIEVLIQFIRQLGGNLSHTIALTEQGWTSVSQATERNEYLDQAASIAYGYLKTESLNDIEALILSRQVDALEMGNQYLKFGLEDENFQPKYSYSVYRDLGTSSSLYTSALLPVLTEAQTGYLSKSAGGAQASASWSENYNSTELLVNSFSLSDAASTSKCVKTLLNGMNASSSPYFTVTVNLNGKDAQKGQTVQVSLRLFSGEKIQSVTIPGVLVGYSQTLTFDFSGWSGLSHITGAELWIKGMSGTGTLQLSGLQTSGSRPSQSPAEIADIQVTGLDETGYTVTATFTVPGRVSRVLMPTWTEANGQDDLIWYTASVNGSKATYRVPVTDHNKEAGTYHTHVYVYRSDGSYALDGVEEEVPALKDDSGSKENPGSKEDPESEKLKITGTQVTDLSSSGYTVTATFTAPAGLSRVLMPTWTDANGQDDLIWYTASVSGNTATFRVPVTDHKNESGHYHTHIYVYDKKGKYVLTGLDIQVPAGQSAAAPTIASAQVTNLSASGYTVTASFSAPAGLSRVLMPTWTDANGQDDLIWYTASVSGNTATFRVPVTDHKNESGHYHTHIYVYDKKGKYVLTGLDIQVPAVQTAAAPTITGAKATDLSASGYTVTATFTAPAGLSRVLMPTWTDANGQDDLIWYTASVSGNTATFRVPVTDHKNESGHYHTHVYVYDSQGRYALTGLDIEVPASQEAAAPTIISAQATDLSASGYKVTASFSAPAGLSRVLMPTWTDANGQDDLIWYTASVSGNTATFRVPVTDHRNESGHYHTHVYVYDSQGRYALTGLDIQVPAGQSAAAPTITGLQVSGVSAAGYIVTASFSAPAGLSRVLMPTWTDANGQDDLIWYTANVSGNTATFTVKSSSHQGQHGRYITHVYVYDAQNRYALQGTAVNVP